jgi:two-component system chemotaxis response regulator CheB
VIAILLSGLLDDGSSGLMAVKMTGGTTIVQDPSEAAVPEMPLRAIEYAHPDQILNISQIAEFLGSITPKTSPISDRSEPDVSHELDNEIKQASLTPVPQEEFEGVPSVFACPDCHGVLWEVKDGKLLRFRCRVGHAYTADALQLAMSDASEDALWIALRTLEEKAALLRRLAARSQSRMGVRYSDEASGFEKHAQTIRDLLAENQSLRRQEKEVSGAA